MRAGRSVERGNIGIIGIGLLGTALAQRLTAAGYQLIGYDPDSIALKRLQALGGTPGASSDEVARTCNRILFSLPGPAQVRDTVAEIEPHLQAGSVILDTTTGDPEAVEANAEQLAKLGVAYLDCEIGGSSKQVVEGEAIVICGGDEGTFEECSEILAAISPRVFRMGAAGTGTRMKLALNIAIGLHRAVLAEALSFAMANGVDAARALEILKAGPGYSRAMDSKGRKMVEHDFVPEARLAQHLKDVGLILNTGKATGAFLPLSHLHHKLLTEAAQRGLGGEDNSAIIKIFEPAL